MATLTENANLSYENSPPRIETEQPMIAADTIFEGAFVGDNGSGFARPLVAGDPFLGVAARKADNESGAAGDKNVKLYTRVIVGPIAVAGYNAETQHRAKVYASDDGALTLTSGSNTLVGKIHRKASLTDGTAYVFCEADSLRVDL